MGFGGCVERAWWGEGMEVVFGFKIKDWLGSEIVGRWELLGMESSYWLVGGLGWCWVVDKFIRT